jgi:hypothetical protein
MHEIDIRFNIEEIGGAGISCLHRIYSSGMPYV